MSNVEQTRESLLPSWARTRTAKVAGTVGLLILLACSSVRTEYDSGEGARSVDAGVDVYDDMNDLGSCGETSQDKTATPIGAEVKEDNVGGLQDGQVMKYEFAGGALALVAGHTCEGSVWVHGQQAPAA